MFKNPIRIINEEFTWFLVTRTLFTIGIRMTTVLLGWYLYELTGSKLALGILGLSEVIPAISLALPAGVKVDTSNKKNLIMTCLGGYLLAMVVFAIITRSAVVDALGAHTVEYLIYLMVAITGLVRAYISPAFSAFIAQMVTKDQLVQAATTTSMTWLVAAMIGPFLAGILIGVVGVTFSFALVAVFIILSMLAFAQIESKPITYQKGSTKTWDSVKEGLTFVFKQKALLGAMGLDMFAVLFGGVVALLPVFAKDILHVGPQGFGILMSATYLGNFIALLYFANRPLKGKQGNKLIYAVAGFGVCILVFALSTNLVLSFIALMVSGLFDGVSMLVRATIFQILVPDEMRGRVSSVNSVFINSSNELGQFESGTAASIMGTVPSVVFGGVMTLLIAGFSYVKIPALRKLEY